MALLSLIVPVYRVEEYLAECLDSLLDQSFTDFEVIAVDDASPDGSAEILARYAALDSRIRVVTLPRNVGLGAARNTGLRQATGTYVWCVDSDDWLPPGTLQAVADRLARTTPDLLVTGYARVYWDGRVEDHPVTAVHGGRPVPETFTFAEVPGLLNHLWIACNKVIRREFLVRTGITFGPGWYEDVAFILPLMLASERISLLDRDCYAYRQRQQGAITRTVSDRHLEVFDQWDRVFEYMDSRPGDFTTLRPVIFQRMIWHCLQVLGHASRVPGKMRRTFFARITAQYRRHLPAGGAPVAAGNDGLKQRLVAIGAYQLFELLMTAWQVRQRLTGRRPQAGSPAPRRVVRRSPIKTG
ncbi:glycosyltransferase family 2 protein [Micromonospora sp. NBC_01796]|uniref:glycosyltransferase family 2 protein n=1 Tax=Micromonospora sp. NBC_01796 TaxID=2975987 RepID=UPI002DDBDFFA|nr:glycosyltransferase family 2 protein [Micromonospora sp. NBC_01796]WSA85444.1 glycosyltransferase [Micromonospora sp. NBC_01796]